MRFLVWPRQASRALGLEKEQVRHCKPGYWSSTKKTEIECRVLSMGRQSR